jgi:6-phosphogluconate dehydrogenase
MQLAMIGLGRMGANMVRRLMKGGHSCVVYDRDAKAVEKMAAEGATPARSIDDVASLLTPPRVAWVMVPAGAPTTDTIASLTDRFRSGDIIIDGGNSYFKDDLHRASALKPRGLHYVDVGTSGGVFGLERGYCLMVGGEKETVEYLEPIWKTLAPGPGSVARTPSRTGPRSTAEEGYLHCGPAGAGHFVKMVHNGIEYGLMQAYAEGFDIMKNAASPQLPVEARYDLPLADIAEVWRRGSVVSSWLLDLMADALGEDGSLSAYLGHVEDSGEGRWTILAAIEEAVEADVLSASLFARFRSRREHTFAEKVLSAMRKKFGGHVEPGKKS